MRDPAKTYQEIFQARGASYDHAMQHFPNARDEEFQALLASAKIKPHEVICDFPSGGNYLPRYLPQPHTLYAVEQCPQFITKPLPSDGTVIIVSDPENLGLSSNSIDCFVSLAGIHHMDDKTALFSEMKRLLKPGGRFCIGDVHSQSPVAAFLDTVVDRYNSQGHQGVYLNETTCETLRQLGLTVTDATLTKYHWNFKDLDELVEYCSLLFGMDQMVPADFIDETEALLNIEQDGAGCHLQWELFFISGSVADK